MNKKNKIDGWLIIDKPIGLSSNQVLSKLKRLIHPSKIGHSGTLDPLATGVLPVALGEATKTIQFIMNIEKAYEFEITWGENRDTIDAEGEIIETSDKKPNHEEILKVVNSFENGVIKQMPPKFSALKVDGKRAYNLARSGEEFELKSRSVELIELKFLGGNKFFVECGKGFYVRSIARDICSKLGVCGYVSSLRRVKSGNITEKDAISLDSLEKIVHNDSKIDGKWSDFIHPLTHVLDDILVHEVSVEDAKKLKNGMSVHSELSLSSEETFIVAQNKMPIALCTIKGNYIKPSRVFNL